MPLYHTIGIWREFGNKPYNMTCVIVIVNVIVIVIVIAMVMVIVRSAGVRRWREKGDRNKKTGDRVCGPLWECQAQPWLEEAAPEEAAPEVSAVEVSPVEVSPVEASPVEESSWRAAASSSTAARRESSWL